jgi:non-canonical (house-cleaning) NTP pyrophosphatase
MKVVLASESKVKIAAVQKAFSDTSIELVPISVPSHVSEQPFDDETLTGAFNRLNAAQLTVPDADMYIAIENGIFEEDGHFVDRAIVAITHNGNEPSITYSEGVRFPAEAVAEAKQKGFDKTTVGKVMATKGWVQDHADPHKDLIGKSRAVILAETMKAALS